MFERRPTYHYDTFAGLRLSVLLEVQSGCVLRAEMKTKSTDQTKEKNKSERARSSLLPERSFLISKASMQLALPC